MLQLDYTRMGSIMAFLLNDVVPWGRTLWEYRKIFSLSDDDMKLKIASFGDGPSSFNYESTKNGYKVTSYDIIYQFSHDDIEKRIREVKNIVMKQMEQNMENYIWTQIKDLSELESLRMGAMKLFLDDYEEGKKENRYIYHSLPNKINLPEKTFDIGLSSHFLLMYEGLGYEFHIMAITEMLRLCKEIRIFPICNLDGENTGLAKKVISYFNDKNKIDIVKSEYQFQKSQNEMLIIK